jgi:hypothetical protein
MASGWRGYAWVLKKSGAFRDSAQNGLQTSAGLHMKKCSHKHIHTSLYYVYTNYQKYKMYLEESIGRKKCRIVQRIIFKCLNSLEIAEAYRRACSHEQQCM